MVCRDKVIILNRVEVKDDFGGSEITFVGTKVISLPPKSSLTSTLLRIITLSLQTITSS